jgi:hypothetical protein
VRKKIIINLLFLFFICFAASFFTQSASAEIVFGKDYYRLLHKYLSQAENSINVAMYFIIIDPEDKANSINDGRIVL